ncbi:MAG: hypothetical protein OXC37_03285 [Bdellovibrionaceae bacterium]|nr:hypothetical protein [Pseudobdellovibrionaceae bacterium]
MKTVYLNLFCLIFILEFVFFNENVFADTKTKEQINTQNQTYSFRPLLIQGKKRLIQKIKDLEIKTDNILETEIFFENIDFKKRIFVDEGLE